MPRTPEADHPRVYSRGDLREIDRRAAAEFGIPTLLLMENAARNLAEVALDGLGDDADPAALIVCGAGNNAGDGLAAARHLHNAGVRVSILLVLGDDLQGDALTHLNIARRMGLTITQSDDDDPDAGVAFAWDQLPGMGVVIDAIFGTGLSRTVTGPALRAIRGINALAARGAPVLAVDCPSGLDADTGSPLGDAVHASVTASFVGLKTGFLSLAAQEYLGEVIVTDIGAPVELTRSLGRAFVAPAHPETRASEATPKAEKPARRGRRREEV